MLRLSVLLSAVIFVTLLIAGEDKGQMRPGLAAAMAEGQPIVTLTRSFSPTVPVAPAPVVAKADTDALPPPVEMRADAPAAVIAASATRPVTETPAPIFTLSDLPTLGGDRVRYNPAPAPVAAEAASDPVADDRLRYIAASSVNVRMGPGTGNGILGRLTAGEAVRVISSGHDGWAEISIEGDGIHGYVAERFLAASAP